MIVIECGDTPVVLMLILNCGQDKLTVYVSQNAVRNRQMGNLLRNNS